MKRLLKNAWRKVRKWARKFAMLDDFADLGDLGLPSESSSPAESKPGEDSPTQAPTTSDEVAFAALDWRYGGFKGGKATLSDRARIKGLKVTRNGLSYSWESGGCEDMGASGPHDAACLACLFCHVRDQWLGGKFDWISTDRRTRDLENIESGYGGWEYEAFRDADAYAFVIVSKDGKRRTNVIMQKGRN